MMATLTPGANRHFATLGIQYYIAARCGVLSQSIPVAANQFHHAIEMFLKARLCQEVPLQEMKRAFGHKLTNLWDAFKSKFPSESLGHFDDTITLLDKFEQLRYPDSVITQGAAILYQWSCAATVPAPSGSTTPGYVIVVNDIDQLVARSFQLSKLNPVFFTHGLPAFALEIVSRNNPVVKYLFEG